VLAAGGEGVTIIRIVCRAGPFGPSSEDGQYVRACSVDAYNGIGHVEVTPDPERARQFDSVLEAVDFYRRQSNVMPLRDDGKPNRPLTCYTVEFVRRNGDEQARV